ncbi:MAG: hypothetical protein FJ291_32260 [Planctomycetes bacterium]|nr:hypothetical protein [Planctomycetota bacterium]
MRIGLLMGCCLLFGHWADADILKTRQGEELRGTVQLVTFLVKDIQTIYPREEVVSLQIGAEGNDALDVRSEGKQEGRLVSVMFEAPAGIRAVTRDKLASVTFDSATTMESIKSKQREETDAKEEQKTDLTAEQRQALTKNRELYKAYTDAAGEMKDEGYEAVKAKFMDRVREVINEVQRLERSIQNKIQRREQASTRSSTTSRGGTTNMSERERLERYDGLANDQRDLDRARANATKLRSTIRAEEKKVREKADQRLSRLETAYTGNRAKLFGGETMTEDDMTARYEAALRLPGEKAPKPPKTTPPKNTKSAADPKTPSEPKPARTVTGLEDLKGN